jgi:hypothetical protein
MTHNQGFMAPITFLHAGLMPSEIPNSRPLDISVVSSEAPPVISGIATCVRRLAAGLTDKGYTSRIFSSAHIPQITLGEADVPGVACINTVGSHYDGHPVADAFYSRARQPRTARPRNGLRTIGVVESWPPPTCLSCAADPGRGLKVDDCPAVAESPTLAGRTAVHFCANTPGLAHRIGQSARRRTGRRMAKKERD